MDSEWFAVDACGHVGFFETGEAGAMPRQAGIGGQGEGWDLLERLRELFPPGEVIRAPDAPRERLDEPDHDPARLGLFAYSHELFENGLAGPYSAQGRPRNPITSAQLPADVRAAVEALRFPFCFAKYPQFQPADHVPCDAWTGTYLSNDLRTLRAFPGEVARARSELTGEDPDPGMTIDLDRPWTPLPVPPTPQRSPDDDDDHEAGDG